VEKAPVRIETVISDAVETLRPFADSREIDLELSLCETVADPPRIVIGDRTRLGQIFGNLLHNAIKFSERGGRVHISCEELTDGHIRVQVADEGQGINSHFLPHVFERFRQEDSSTTRAHGGLGIGLALVKSFVEAHRGTVEAISAGEGRGSRMVITLPLQKIGTQDFTEQDNTVPSPSLRISTGNEQLHALIVEDAEDTLAMLDTLFTRYNFITTLCPTPEAALAAAANGQFEIIICDIGLPGMDGYELIKRFRQIPSLRNVPAVALTGFAGPKEQEKALAAGFDEHIAKPVTPPVLMAKLEELFRVKSGR
jgi:CheY-like chemotaxis protein/two-component sensor histidine kinase